MASPRERVILLLKFVWYGEVFLRITEGKRLLGQSSTGLPEEKTACQQRGARYGILTFIILPKATLP